jgi:hypothetical protein
MPVLSISAVPITKLFAWVGGIVEDMSSEILRAEALVPVRNPVLERMVRLFSLVPLVWQPCTPRVGSSTAASAPGSVAQ